MREKTRIVKKLSGDHELDTLLRAAHLARSSYYWAVSHPDKKLPRVELHDRIREIFHRTANGMGHRQIAMCLRHDGIRIADKTVLKIMKLLGLYCQIRRKGRGTYCSFKGIVGETFVNVLQRDFHADKPWEKMGTDVTEFKQAWGKAYLAPIYDFASKEIVAFSISQSPNLAQQEDLLDKLLSQLPQAATPIIHSDMGWQYQHATWVKTLKCAGAIQSMSRKGNCLDNAATEQVFGHLKDEFFRGQVWESFEEFKHDLTKYIHYWNTMRRQQGVHGLTPEEFRNQSMHTLK